MESANQDEEWSQPFYVGHYDTHRAVPVTSEVLDQANDCNYDMVTTPITNAHFSSRVLELISKYRSEAPNDELACPSIPALTLNDTPLTPGDITPQLIAVASSWTDICSLDPLISGLSRQVLGLEIAYAAFCGIEYVLVPGPKLYHEDSATHGILQYARAIQNALSVGSHLQISVMLPMIDRPDIPDVVEETSLVALAKDVYFDDAEELRPKKADEFGTWDAWNLIRSTCKYNTRLLVALAIPKYLPPSPSIQSRWYSEPIKAITLRADIFVHNKHGSPSLPTATRNFISRLMRVKMGPWILLEGVDPIPNRDEFVTRDDGTIQWKPVQDILTPTPAEASSSKEKIVPKSRYPFVHLEYIRWLQQQQPPRTAVERYGSGYQDYLQVPLQPLTDNLESMTYEVFEKDPVKYDLYEEAICKALRDWKKEKKPTSGPNGKVVVAVAGAGRGPLVTRALKASDAEGVPIEMWAVEKNPNAYVLLQQHNQTTWGGRVNIVKSDMRSWKGPWRPNTTATTSRSPATSDSVRGDSSPPISVPNPCHTQIDILVSELLGSFADNELSPECLDGILHLLAPSGISIPRSYTAYLTPIAAPKLHADILSRSAWDPTAPETPSVVWLHAIDYLSLMPNSKKADGSAEARGASAFPADKVTPAPLTTPNVLPVWSFHHVPMTEQPPAPVSNTHNTRFTRLNFRTRDRGVCHGLGGYFESVLYPGVDLSTNPNTMEEKSNSMISWFPIFFPLKTPMYIPDNSALTVSLWRQTDDRKVWYEWIVESWAWNLKIGGEPQRVLIDARLIEISTVRLKRKPASIEAWEEQRREEEASHKYFKSNKQADRRLHPDLIKVPKSSPSLEGEEQTTRNESDRLLQPIAENSTPEPRSHFSDSSSTKNSGHFADSQEHRGTIQEKVKWVEYQAKKTAKKAAKFITQAGNKSFKAIRTASKNVIWKAKTLVDRYRYIALDNNDHETSRSGSEAS